MNTVPILHFRARGSKEFHRNFGGLHFLEFFYRVCLICDIKYYRIFPTDYFACNSKIALKFFLCFYDNYGVHLMLQRSSCAFSLCNQTPYVFHIRCILERVPITTVWHIFGLALADSRPPSPPRVKIDKTNPHVK